MQVYCNRSTFEIDYEMCTKYFFHFPIELNLNIFLGFVSYQELGETTSSGVKIYTIQIQVRTSLGAQKFKGSGRNKKLARAKASLSALTHLFPGEY
jgi:hypothetical protein